VAKIGSVTTESSEDESVPLFALISAALRRYDKIIQFDLLLAGYVDLSATGILAIECLARRQLNMSGVTRDLGVSKQSASASIQKLVVHGYCARVPDALDRRQVNVRLTDRGHAAAREITKASKRIHLALETNVGPEVLSATCVTLRALAIYDRRQG
jgi:DNA-binding MarR family transcriptional regulator